MHLPTIGPWIAGMLTMGFIGSAAGITDMDFNLSDMLKNKVDEGVAHCTIDEATGKASIIDTSTGDVIYTQNGSGETPRVATGYDFTVDEDKGSCDVDHMDANVRQYTLK